MMILPTILVKKKNGAVVPPSPATPQMLQAQKFLMSNKMYRDDKNFQEHWVSNLQHLEWVNDTAYSLGGYLRFKYGHTATHTTLQAITTIHPSGKVMVEDTGENDAFRDPPYYMPVYYHDPVAVSGDYPCAAGGFWIHDFNITRYVLPPGNLEAFIEFYNDFKYSKLYKVKGLYAFGIRNSAGTGLTPVDFTLQGNAGGDPTAFSDIVSIDFTSNTSQVFVTEDEFIDISGTALNSAARLTPMDVLTHRIKSAAATPYASLAWAPAFFALVVVPVDGIAETPTEMLENYLGGPLLDIYSLPTTRLGDHLSINTVRHDGSQQSWYDNREPYKHHRMFSIDKYQQSSEQFHVPGGRVGSWGWPIDIQGAAIIASAVKFYLQPANNKFDMVQEYQNHVSRDKTVFPVLAQTWTFMNIPGTPTHQRTFTPPTHDPNERYFRAKTVKYNDGSTWHHRICIQDYPTGYDGSTPILITDAAYWIDSDYPIDQGTQQVTATYPVIDEQVIGKLPGTDGNSPTHYPYHGELAHEYGAAFGSNTFATVSRTVDPVGPAENYALNGNKPLIEGYSDSNEDEGPWKNAVGGYHTPQQMAAKFNASLDGWCGTMGTNVGLWQDSSDPDMDIRTNAHSKSIYAWIQEFIDMVIWQRTGVADDVNYYTDPFTNGNPKGTGKIILCFNIYPNISGDQVLDYGGAGDVFAVPMGEYQVHDMVTYFKSKYPFLELDITEFGVDEVPGYTWTGSAWVPASGVTSFVAPPLIPEHIFRGPYDASGEGRWSAPWTKAVMDFRMQIFNWSKRVRRAHLFQQKSNTALGAPGFPDTFATCGIYDKDGDPWFLVYIGYAIRAWAENHEMVGNIQDMGTYYLAQTLDAVNGDTGYFIFKKDLGGSPIQVTIDLVNPTIEAYQLIPYGQTATSWDVSTLTDAPDGNNLMPATVSMILPANATLRNGQLSQLSIVNDQVTTDCIDMPIFLINPVAPIDPPGSGTGDGQMSITYDETLATYTHPVAFSDFNAGAGNRVNLLQLHGNGETGLTTGGSPATSKAFLQGTGTGVPSGMTGNRRTLLEWCIANNYHIHLVSPYISNTASVGPGVITQYGNYFATLPGLRFLAGLSGGGIIAGKAAYFNNSQFDKYVLWAGWLWAHDDAFDYGGIDIVWFHGDADGQVSIGTNEVEHPDYDADPTVNIVSVIFQGGSHFIWDPVCGGSYRMYEFLKSPAASLTNYDAPTLPDPAP